MGVPHPALHRIASAPAKRSHALLLGCRRPRRRRCPHFRLVDVDVLVVVVIAVVVAAPPLLRQGQIFVFCLLGFCSFGLEAKTNDALRRNGWRMRRRWETKRITVKWEEGGEFLCVPGRL